MEALGITLFALGIAASIMLHEAGHMVTAKRYGMKVTQYFVGFGPTLWSMRRGETEYGVKAIPAGGFVKIIGMTPQEEVAPEDEERAMWRQPLRRRTVVLAAGSITHFILVLLLIWCSAVFAKLPNPEFDQAYDQILAGTSVGYVAACFNEAGDLIEDPADCTAADVPGPAFEAGLRSGDEIVSVNGAPVEDWQSVSTTIRALPADTPAELVVETDGGGSRTVTLTPATVAATDQFGRPVEGESVVRVGVGPPLPDVPANVSYGPVAAVPATLEFTWDVLVIGTVKAIAKFPEKVPGLVDAVRGEQRDPEGPISVVGASRVGGEAFALGGRTGLEGFLLILASLNLFIGVFNLFPLLPLDGGHIAIAWYERARTKLALRRGRPDPGRVDYNKLMPVTFVVILVFGAISVLAIVADVINPIRLG